MSQHTCRMSTCFCSIVFMRLDCHWSIHIYIHNGGSVSSLKPFKYHEPSTSRNAVKKSLAHDVSSFPRLHPLNKSNGFAQKHAGNEDTRSFMI